MRRYLMQQQHDLLHEDAWKEFFQKELKDLLVPKTAHASGLWQGQELEGQCGVSTPDLETITAKSLC